MIKKKIFIATGGTGGHIFPGYSLAKNLKSKNFSVKLITDLRGFSYLKNYENIDFKIISSSPLVKKNFLDFIYSLFIIISSCIKSIFYLILNRPAIIFGMGGYSSFPICIAAFFLRIKFIVYENNLTLGKADRYLLPFTEKIFVSYKELEGIPKKI